MKPRRWALVAAAAIALGLAARLHAAWTGRGAVPLCADPQEEYFQSALILLAEKSFSRDPGGGPQVRHGPLYPSFLALSQLGSKTASPRRAALAQALLGGLAALAAWGLGRRLHSPAAAALAAAFVALDPRLIAATNSLDVHGFYGAVVLLLAWALAEGRFVGPALALSLLTRGAHLLFLPFAGLKPLLLAAALLLPWTARNWMHSGRLVPLDAGVGAYNLLGASQGYDRAITVGEAFSLAEELQPGFAAAHIDAEPAERERAFARLARAEIARAPGRWLAGCARRLRAFWSPLWPLLLLAAFAPNALKPWLLAASFSAYAAIGLGRGYALGVEPLLAALAGAGLGRLVSRKQSAPAPAWSALPALAPAAAALLLLLLLPFDALAERGRPRCEPPDPRLLSFIDEGARVCGRRWPLSAQAGSLRARPHACAAIEAFKAGRLPESLRELEAALALAPEDPSLRLSRAVALDAAGRRRESLLELELAERFARERAGGERAALLAAARSTRESLQRR